jgi:hypothetical protein
MRIDPLCNRSAVVVHDVSSFASSDGTPPVFRLHPLSESRSGYTITNHAFFYIPLIAERFHHYWHNDAILYIEPQSGSTNTTKERLHNLRKWQWPD